MNAIFFSNILFTIIAMLFATLLAVSYLLLRRKYRAFFDADKAGNAFVIVETPSGAFLRSAKYDVETNTLYVQLRKGQWITIPSTKEPTFRLADFNKPLWIFKTNSAVLIDPNDAFEAQLLAEKLGIDAFKEYYEMRKQKTELEEMLQDEELSDADKEKIERYIAVLEKKIQEYEKLYSAVLLDESDVYVVDDKLKLSLMQKFKDRMKLTILYPLRLSRINEFVSSADPTMVSTIMDAYAMKKLKNWANKNERILVYAIAGAIIIVAVVAGLWFLKSGNGHAVVQAVKTASGAGQIAKNTTTVNI